MSAADRIDPRTGLPRWLSVEPPFEPGDEEPFARIVRVASIRLQMVADVAPVVFARRLAEIDIYETSPPKLRAWSAMNRQMENGWPWN